MFKIKREETVCQLLNDEEEMLTGLKKKQNYSTLFHQKPSDMFHQEIMKGQNWC